MTTLVHPHLTGVMGIVALGIWLHLFFGRGGFWRVKKFDADRAECAELSEWPSVIVVVPARNEAGTIGQTIAELIRQDYPGKYFVVVVDDHSEDGTANFARRVAAENSAVEQVRIVSAAALPAAWTGKVWALHEGVSSAAAEAPTYFWFTDADVGHAPDTRETGPDVADGAAPSEDAARADADSGVPLLFPKALSTAVDC